MIKKIGIRREDKNKWERRVPLAPGDVARLVSEHGLSIALQPSTLRIFPDEAFIRAGAKISENISDCDLLIGVKEFPISFFRPGGMYMFFSHTIKGQKHNMPALKRLKELKCSLLDYERITDDKGRRLVFFGYYAGLAGMIDTLWALGKRLRVEGFQTPFERVRLAHEYADLAEARKAISEVGEDLKKNGVPLSLQPLVMGFAGYGNVSRGAQEIFDLLPHRAITPEELASEGLHSATVATSAASATNATNATNEILKVVFREEHTVRPKDRGAIFNLREFFGKPEKYETGFRKFLDKLTVLVNCIFWSPSAPRLITLEEADEIWRPRKTAKLRVIGDISCDLGGAIQFTTKETQPDSPIFVYDPQTREMKMGAEGFGPVVMAVDNLPCEVSAESSKEFSRSIMPFFPDLAKIDPGALLHECGLPPELKRAVLLWNGDFAPDYQYMEKFI